MKIKITPEGDERIQEVEHTNVKEFFIFGSKKDSEGELIDFHDWSGQYRYLIGSIYYFLEMVKAEHINKAQNLNNMSLPSSPMSPVPFMQEGGNDTPMIKRGEVKQPHLTIVDTEPAEVQEVETTVEEIREEAQQTIEKEDK